MPGFCEGCPVPEVLSKAACQDGLNPYWSEPEVHSAAADLMIKLSKMSECVDGPEIEGLGMDTEDILVSCSHPESDIMSCLGETLDYLLRYSRQTYGFSRRAGAEINSALGLLFSLRNQEKEASPFMFVM